VTAGSPAVGCDPVDSGGPHGLSEHLPEAGTVIPPLVFLGAATLVLGGYVTLNADAEFEAGMSLQGVDPREITARARQSGVRRNRIVGGAVALLGLGLLAWGVLG